MEKTALELLELSDLVEIAKEKLGYNESHDELFEKQDQSDNAFKRLLPLVGMGKALKIVNENPEMVGSAKWLEKNSHLWRKVNNCKSFHYFLRYTCLTCHKWNKSYYLQIKKILIDFLKS